MKIVILHDSVAPEANPDELDALVQAQAVSGALTELGHEPVDVAFSFEVDAATDALRAVQPNLVFNLVESVEGQGRFVHLAPALLDYLGLPYTGSPAEAVFLSSHKLTAKKLLQASGVPTPPWLTHDHTGDVLVAGDASFIVKSVWEHASIGISDESLVRPLNPQQLRCEINRRREQLCGDCFAELFIEGREFNISLLASEDGPEVLPPAEIEFVSYPPEKARIVDYDAKWNPDSFAYHHTPRCFDFPDADRPLLRQLKAVARRCWNLFGLRGYARVDFRVDPQGRPWVLEVNANPCISPDSGFVAAADRAGLSFPQMIQRIIEDSPAPRDKPSRATKPRRLRSAHKDTTASQSPSVCPDPVCYRGEVTEADVANVRRIVESSGFFSGEEVNIAVQLVEERLRRGGQSGYHFLFAEQGGRVVGYTCFGLISGTQRSYEVYWIAVHDTFRGKGIGKELLSRTEREIATRGGRRVYVDTSSRSTYEPTRCFYRRRGYRQEAFLKDFYSPGDAKLIYVKELTPVQSEPEAELPSERATNP